MTGIARSRSIAIDDSAARRAVELGEHDARDPRGSQELARLAERVLPGRRIEHEERLDHLTGRAIGDATNLGQLVEQVRRVGPSTRGVGEHEVDAPRVGAADRVVDHRAGVGALVGADDLGAGARRPLLELVGRRRTERVTRGEQDAAALLVVALGQLADGRGLAHAVDPDEEPHGTRPSSAVTVVVERSAPRDDSRSCAAPPRRRRARRRVAARRGPRRSWRRPRHCAAAPLRPRELLGAEPPRPVSDAHPVEDAA